MGNTVHCEKLEQGKKIWNAWRKENPEEIPNFSNVDLANKDFSLFDFSGTNFVGADLSGAKFVNTNLSGAKFGYAKLFGADFRGANLRDAKLIGVELPGVDLSYADLTGADLHRANLMRAGLSGAKLVGATLIFTSLTEANFENADLTGCSVYGCSAWNVKLRGALQHDLIITPDGEPKITVDNLEVAQFIYLLLNNEKIRQVIDTITSKVVLILGRFTNERKRVLDAMREELRFHDYLPVLFDFEKPAHRDLTETISTLAHMARFVIADITDAKSIAQELKTIIPDLPSVPVQPLLLTGQYKYGMFEHFQRYPWVLESFLYDNEEMLLTALKEKIIGPAEAKAKERTAK